MKKTYKAGIQKILDDFSINNEVTTVFKIWGYLHYYTKNKNTKEVFKHKLNIGINSNFNEVIELIKLTYSQTNLIDFLEEANNEISSSK